MFSTMLHGEIGEQHKQDMLRQARTHHLRRIALGNHDSLYRRWLAATANLLIAAGTRIQRHGERVAQARRAALNGPVLDWERLRAR